MTELGTLYANAGEPVRALCRAPVPGLCTEVRTLLSDLNCLFDGRDNRLVAIVQTECDGKYPQRALYELREKYFGVPFDVLEERTHRPNQEGHWQPVLAVRFFVHNEMIAIVGKSNRLIPASRRTLMAENPVRGYGLYLRLDPRLGTAPQLADAKPWRAALHQLGRPPEALDKVLAPNPNVRYAPRPG